MSGKSDLPYLGDSRTQVQNARLLISCAQNLSTNIAQTMWSQRSFPTPRNLHITKVYILILTYGTTIKGQINCRFDDFTAMTTVNTAKCINAEIDGENSSSTTIGTLSSLLFIAISIVSNSRWPSNALDHRLPIKRRRRTCWWRCRCEAAASLCRQL